MFDLPVTVVTGYLGSGKTTHINRRLKQAEGIRYAVLINDFGDLNIDVELIEDQTASSINLMNGCVCCSIGNDVEGALEQLRAVSNSIDWVLLEASGVADSKRVRNQVLNWPGFELRDVLSLVDVTLIRKLVDDKFIGNHIRQQLVLADRLVLTKTDLVSENDVREVESWLSQFSSQVAENETHPDFFTQSYLSETPISRKQLSVWLERLTHAVRIKGFVYLKDDPDNAYLLQWVEAKWTLDKLGPWQGRSKTRIVTISSEPSGLGSPEKIIL